MLVPACGHRGGARTVSSRDFGGRLHDFGIELRDTLGTASGHVELDVRHGQLGLSEFGSRGMAAEAVAPGACHMHERTAIDEAELCSLECGCNLRKPLVEQSQI